MSSTHSEFDLPTRPINNKGTINRSQSDQLLEVNLGNTDDRNKNNKKPLYLASIILFIAIAAGLTFYNVKLNNNDNKVIITTNNNGQTSNETTTDSSQTKSTEPVAKTDTTGDSIPVDNTVTDNAFVTEEIFIDLNGNDDSGSENKSTTEEQLDGNRNKSDVSKKTSKTQNIKKKQTNTQVTKSNPLNRQLLSKAPIIRVPINANNGSLNSIDFSYQQNENYLQAKKLYLDGFITASTNKMKSIEQLEEALRLAPKTTILRSKIETQILKNKNSLASVLK